MSKTKKASEALAALEEKHKKVGEKAKVAKFHVKAFCYFYDKYKATYGFGYVPYSKPGDIAMMKVLVEAHDYDSLVPIIDYYIEHYESEFKSPRYELPKIGGLKIVAAKIAMKLRSTQKKTPTQVAEEDEPEWL